VAFDLADAAAIRAVSGDRLPLGVKQVMTTELSDILKKALSLPSEARAALARSLLKSLEEHPPDQGMEAAWSEEIKRRIEEVDSGKVQLIPYEEVRRRLMARRQPHA
jgi:putative addiction module component (TIGR02574 family)